MSKHPLKPLNKSTKTTVKWTKSADDRLLRLERQLDNIEKRLKKIISKRFQTITYYGLERKKLNDFILRNGITGVDRIVPVGRAFDIGPIWDGYDIIHSLSRIISN